MGRSAVAEALRDADRERNARRGSQERVEVAFRLAREAVALYAQAHGLSEAEARRILRERKHAGRRPSVASAF